MRRKLAELLTALRAGGLAPSVAESIDAAEALAVVGVERAALRDGLAAALVKDERDRPIFEDAFARVFPARAPAAPRRARRGPRPATSEAGVGGAVRAGGAGQAGGTPAAPGAPRRTAPAASRVPVPSPQRDGRELSPATRDHRADAPSSPAEPARDGAAATALARRQRERALLAMPFAAMGAREIEACAPLVVALARRLAARRRRRRRARPRGRLDFRRTLRAAVPRGGVALERRWRARRRARVELVALCDLSASTATASGFFLALLAPAAAYFARVRLFGYVDRLVEIEFVDGQVRPAGPLDLAARSDFGRVLRDLAAAPAASLTRATVLLILGDARNNRRPPRADLLAAVRARVRRVLWLNPEPVARWDSGDSVMATYARHADAVVACGSLAELDRALGAVARL